MPDFSGAQLYLHVRLGTQKASTQNQIARPTKKINWKHFFVPFVAFILNGFPSKVFAMRLLVEFPEKDASQTVIFLLGAVQKNILKARSFHKTKLRHRCLSNSLQILLSFILIVLVIDLLVDLNFKWI